ncbi:MAG TPA: spermine synthase [Anaerolineaceae bacterium]|nr:spermine synthase [Anaerolineaceae bacterium]
MQRRIFITVFFTGLVSLAIELSASRLLSNYFGSSNLIWACIIGSILIYMTIGSVLGGKRADRSPHEESLYETVMWAAFSTGLIPSISKPLLRLASQAMDHLDVAPLVITFIVVLLLFSIPMILLSMASPFAIRLLVENTRESGNLAGKVYAVSTVGSFIGTFLPVLVLIPSLGTYRTFLVLSGILFLVSLGGFLKTKIGWKKVLVKYSWMLVVVVLCAWVGLRGSDKIADGLIYEKESQYNYIQVQQQSGYNMLRLNEGQGIHSIYHPDTLDYQATWRQVIAAPFFNAPPYQTTDVHAIAILGLAGGTSARQAASVFPNSHMDGFEIDETVIEVGEQYFGLNDIPNLTVYAQDARLGLRMLDTKYQLISIDAYRPPYIPAHLTTVEFFTEVYNHLSEDGVLVINVAQIGGDRRLVDALATTIRQVFPSIYVSDVPNTFNSIIYATRAKTTVDNLYSNYLLLDAEGNMPSLLKNTLETTIINLQPVGESKLVFTDDKAPIEQLVNSMLIDFYLSGGIEKLQ